MAEVTEPGYQDLRDYIEANWDYMEPYDDNQNAILRIDVSDGRLQWTHTAGSQTLVLEGVFQGSDSDISLPQTFSGSRIFDVGTDGDAYSDESFTNFTMEDDNDQITIEHEIEVPEVV